MTTLNIDKLCLPEFYHSLLHLWSQTGNVLPVKKENIIWFNKSILIDGKGVFYNEFFKAGLWFVNDLYDCNKRVVPFSVWESRGVHRQHMLRWMGLLAATKKLAKGTHSADETISLTLGVEKPLANMNNKIIYQELLSGKITDVVCTPKASKYLETQNIRWSDVYCWANAPMDTKTKEFQYKFVNDILANNYWLHKWGIKDSAECTYCNEGETESIRHMFWDCRNTQQFWQLFKEFYENKMASIDLTIELVFWGSPECMKSKLILAAKHYIYNKRIHSNDMSFNGYIASIKKLRMIEKQMAIENNWGTDEWYENWNFLDE